LSFFISPGRRQRCLHETNYVTTVYNVNSIDIIFLCFMLWSSGVKMTELKDVCELARELVIKYDTQERAADAAKVHQNIISRLCRGERSDVRLSTYKRMIDALEKTVSQERIAHAPRTGADGLRLTTLAY
jgi:hypothetical protein